ncbi:cytochrome oxidase assembly protein 1, partial [Massospora cicadina]
MLYTCRASNILTKLGPQLKIQRKFNPSIPFTKLYSADTKPLTNLAIERDLPDVNSNRKRDALLVAGGILLWAGVILVSFNYQKQNTSIVRSTLFTAKYNPQVVELLGNDLDFASAWPWIGGAINHLKGRIEISYSIRGSKGNGKLIFKSYRRNDVWVPKVFDVRSDDAVVSLLSDTPPSDSID